MSDLLLIAVPGGTVEGDTATLRVLVVPRLDPPTPTPTPLQDFGLRDWPGVLAQSTLGLEVGETIGGPATPLDATVVSGGSTAVWQSFFSAAMEVNPRQRRVYAAPGVVKTSDYARRIVGNYRESARAFANPIVNVNEVVRSQYAEWRDDDDDDAVPGDVEPGRWQVPDFNRSVSLLREHPAVLKELGLIVELAISVEALHAVPQGSRLVRASFTSGDAAFTLEPVRPWTRFAFDGRRFLPAPGLDSDLRRGMVDLSGAGLVGATTPGASAKWSLVTFDVEGGVGRLREGARAEGAAPGAPGDVSLPVLHSAGIGLVRNGRGEVLRQRANNTTRGNMRSDLEARDLKADDLVLGYRIDIKGETGGWRSLCRRVATYSIDGRIVGTEGLLEEGHVKANAAVIGADRKLRADEIVARWIGWNLAIPRPVFDEQGQRQPDARPPELPFNLKWEFSSPPASLPELRFGRSYVMRARVADMAGGGIKVQDDPTGEEFASELILYRRHEPIPPPEMAPPPGMFTTEGQGPAVPDPKALGAGGTIDILVVRSDPNGDIELDIDEFAQAHPAYPRNDRRTLVAPPTSLAIAEQYDRLNGNDETTWGWVTRTTVPPVVAQDGTYSWLPDPAAVGVMAFVRPDPASPASGVGERSRWVGSWPNHRSKAVQLRSPDSSRPVVQWAATEGTGSPEDTDTLLVHLKPAEQIDLELSSFPRSDDVDKFEISEWVPGAADTLLVSGRHPMMTPPRVLRLIHAVRRPLTPPAGRLAASRNPGETWSVVGPHRDGDPHVGIDPLSTSQVDVTAEWYETFDRVKQPNEAFDAVEPAPPQHTERVVSLTIDRAAVKLPELRHEFGDTRHRRIRYTLTALSRFRQFFDPDVDAAFQREGTLGEVVISSSARPPPPIVLAVSPAFRWEGSAESPGLAQPVRRRRLGGRIRVDLARPWHASGEDERLAVVVKAGSAGPELEPYFTKLLRDPIWATGPAAGFAQLSMFEGMAAPIEECRVAEVEGGRALAVPFSVYFDSDGDRWFADIRMPGGAGGSYNPFVRLVVARYQRESVDGLEISPTVTTDFVQLLPDRTLSIDRAEGGVRVLLEGLGPIGPRTNRVTAFVERCLPNEEGAVSDLTSASPDVPGLWHRLEGHSVTGALGQPLPLLPLPSSDGLMRIVVREIEDIPRTFVEDEGGFAADLRERTVFLDVIRI